MKLKNIDYAPEVKTGGEIVAKAREIAKEERVVIIFRRRGGHWILPESSLSPDRWEVYPGVRFVDTDGRWGTAEIDWRL